ncbi:MAG: SDR family oxidoreductase [Planctomycetes bacterium]|nr:SDR family oxidoreductase [Planctomycetota bacterium]
MSTDHPSRFRGRSAIVTGGGAGIGRAIAERLAREGAAVEIWDRDQAALDTVVGELRKHDPQASGARLDVADDVAVSGAITAFCARRKPLDILIHAAGIVGPSSTPITAVSLADFERVVRVNLTASFIVTKHAVAAMTPQKYGRVLLFASVAGKEGNPGMCSYSASKAGVIGLAKAVGKEVAGSGITVNAIAPAVIRTPLLDTVDQKQIDYMTARIPMGRTGTLDEAAALSCWIVSEEASFNTGFTFDLTGGRATY